MTEQRRLKEPPENIPHKAGVLVKIEDVGETVQKLVEDTDVIDLWVEPHVDGSSWLITWEYAVMNLQEHNKQIYQRQTSLLEGKHIVFPRDDHS